MQATGQHMLMCSNNTLSLRYNLRQPTSPAAHKVQGLLMNLNCGQVLQDLHAEHTTVVLDEQGSLVRVAPLTDLAKPLQEECRRVALTCNELLRHFWACLPTDTQPRQDKAARLDRALQGQYDRYANLACCSTWRQSIASVLHFPADTDPMPHRDRLLA